MLSQLVAYLVLTGIFVWIGGMIVLFWPYRRAWRFAHSRMIDAPRDRIWGLRHVDMDNPQCAALHHETVSVTQVQETPKILEYVLDLSGHGTHLVRLRDMTVAECAPVSCTTRVCELDGDPFPYGAEAEETFELDEQPEGTLTTITWRGETNTLLSLFSLWRDVRRQIRWLKEFSESDVEISAAPNRRKLWTSLILSGAAIGSFALLLGWIGAVLLAAGLMIHEFGHWLAMRMTGQPAPRVLLIPFLGGVAVANHPHKSLFKDAFCALMGPGFSVLPCLALLSVGMLTAPSSLSFGWAVSALSTWDRQEIIAFLAIDLAVLMAFLNAFQMLPVLPLDGGHVLRTLIQSFGTSLARWGLLAASAVAMVYFYVEGLYVFVALLTLGALQAWHVGAIRSTARPMGGLAILTIALGYCLTFGIYAGVIVYGGWLFGIILY